ncbi:hypothetical protein ACFO3O_22110 [Dokdonia ponticola]|uniref:LPXTG cell wall anchor domain-containing protein n=1 Tax=Dokdonia ponticola TaxID=2041041 RepID=A0ABV9I3A2_9FLAO
MIADYIEEDYQEDAFFGNKKKRKARRKARKARRAIRKTSPRILARKARQKVFAKKIGNVYRDLGGASAIGQAVDTLLNPIQIDSQEVPSDFELGLLSQEEQDDAPTEKQGIPVLFFVLGGVLVVGVIGVVIYKKRQSQ